MSTRQYIGARYVPKFFNFNNSSEWRSGVAYEALTIVTRSGNSYTSKIPVPSNIGAPEENPDYWASTGIYNQQIDSYRELTERVAADLADEIDDRESADTALGGRIDAEATARQNADTALGGRIDSEASARESADTALGGRIDAEATARQNADTALGGRIDAEATARQNADNSLGARIDDLIADAQRIFIVGANCQYTTINAAITAASQAITSLGGRMLIVVLPGEYNEQIILRPNPGIDFIGYGATIKGNFSYPNCCVYLSGKTTMVGFYIENGYSVDTLAYALHIERDSSNTSGRLTFVDCEFVSINGSGAGIGMTRNGEVLFKGCRFYSGSSLEDRGALYLHNSQASNEPTQTASFINCWFEGGWNDVRLDDACNIAGGSNSPLRAYFFGCNGRRNRVRFFNTSYTPSEASHDTPGPNITIIGEGNAILALEPNRIKRQEFYAATYGSYAMFPLAYSSDTCTPVITFPGVSNVEVQETSDNGTGGAHSTAGAFQTSSIPVRITYTLH